MINSSGKPISPRFQNPTMATHTPSDLDLKAAELIAKHREFESLKNEFEALKDSYLSELQRQNVGEVNVKEGKIIVCTRTNKDYGHSVKVLEANLKAEKTRLDHLLEFTIKSVTHYLRIG